MEFSQVKSAFKVFAKDYEIVKHPNTPVRTPFDEPNDKDAKFERQYNLTQIPNEITEKQFLNKLKGTLVISCMDKDAAKPLYDHIKKESPDEPIVFFSMAGGIVQEHDERKEALKTILEYVSQHQEKINSVITTDHDHTCGYVKYTLGGTSLAEKLGVNVAHPGKHSEEKEQKAMKSLIAQNIEYFELRKLFGDKLTVVLVNIDRQSEEVTVDDDFDGIEPKKLSDF